MSDGAITTSTEINRPATVVLDYATDPTRFSEWQKGVVDATWTRPELLKSAPGVRPPAASARPTGLRPPA
jgi:hypothetical protein